MDSLITKYQNDKGLVVGISMLKMKDKMDKTEYFDRCILNFMIKINNLKKC